MCEKLVSQAPFGLPSPILFNFKVKVKGYFLHAILRKWQFRHLPERVQSTTWCQKFRLIKAQLLAPRSALYSLRKVLKLPIFCFQSEIFFAILRFFYFAEMAISAPSRTITEHCLVPKSSSSQGATFGTKQYSVIVPEGTQITDFLLPVREFLDFCDFFLFCGNGNLSTFRNDYRALLGAKSCALTRRRFWYQAVLGNRSGRYSNCHFRKRKKIAKVQKFSDRK